MPDHTLKNAFIGVLTKLGGFTSQKRVFTFKGELPCQNYQACLARTWMQYGGSGNLVCIWHKVWLIPKCSYGKMKWNLN